MAFYRETITPNIWNDGGLAHPLLDYPGLLGETWATHRFIALNFEF
jgi:hypothetical protein